MQKRFGFEIPETVFHVTHAKAGSTWVLEVLRQCALDRCFKPRDLVSNSQFHSMPLQVGAIYPSLYITKQELNTVLGRNFFYLSEPHSYALKYPKPFCQNWVNFQLYRKPVLTVVVIRDLRDTLISLYFSLKVSHELTPRIGKIRKILEKYNQEQGLLYLVKNALHGFSKVQNSWAGDSQALKVKYEEILRDEYSVFTKIIDYCNLPVSQEHIRKVVTENSFAYQTGRKPGNEDVTQHQRKGIAGDWENYFTPLIKERFKEKYGQVLIQTGYESDLNW